MPATKPTNKNNPCPICGNTTGHCKFGTEHDNLVFCHSHEFRSGLKIKSYEAIKPSGGWCVFAPIDSPKPEPSTQSKQPNKKNKPWTAEQRDKAFRGLISDKPLHPDDRADLHRRGITDEQIATWGVVSIEGKQPGYICPCYTPDGLIVGAQYRLRNPQDGSRYKWVNWIADGTQFAGELPLTVQRPIDRKPTGIAVVEGIGAKSYILAQRSGMVTIGAGAAAQFAGSKTHWHNYLATLSVELDTNVIHFFPDAGAVQNESVMRDYRKFFADGVGLGYQIKIGWWDQIEKGEVPDVDELESLASIKFIELEEFEAISKSQLSEVDPPKAPEPMPSTNQSRQSPWDCPVVEDYTIGVCETRGRGENKFELFIPRLACDFKIAQILEGNDGGGLVLNVTYKAGRKVMNKQVFIKSIDTIQVKDFVAALIKGLNTRIACTLKAQELQAFLETRQQDYFLAGGKTYRLADRVGRQDDGHWVFENCQFTPDGQICTEEQSGWVFDREMVEAEGIPNPTIAEQSPQALSNLVAAMAQTYQGDTLSNALFEVGYAAAVAHRDKVLEHLHGFATRTIYASKNAYKTSAVKAALSIFGMHRSDLGDFSDSYIYERLNKLGNIPFLIDDPIKGNRKAIEAKKSQLDNLIWATYGGADRGRRGNTQRVNSAFFVTTNVEIGDEIAALDDRLSKTCYSQAQPINDFDALNTAMDQASGALGQIIAIPYDRQAIKAIRDQLLPHLPPNTNRICDTYAVQTYFTQQVCKLAGYEFDAIGHCQQVMCVQVWQNAPSRDDLADFISKLQTLKTEGLIGRWNVVEVAPSTKGHQPYLAIDLKAVHQIFNQRFTVNYSRGTIQNRIAEVGGGESRQKFVKDKSTEEGFIRSEADFMRREGNDSVSYSRPLKPKRDRPSSCYLIPAEVAVAAGWHFEELAVASPENDDLDQSPVEAEWFTQAEAQEIDNCVEIAEVAAQSSPETVSIAWQTLRQLADDRLKRAVWGRLSDPTKAALQKIKDSDLLGDWEVA